MRDLIALDLDRLFNKILLKSENQHEFLLGECQSDFNLTNTQEHILMLLSEEKLSSSELAKRLSITQAAVTKAVKNLLKNDLLIAEKDKNDARITNFSLTNVALAIAEEHKLHHLSTLKEYQSIIQDFNDDELKIIYSFLEQLKEGLEI